MKLGPLIKYYRTQKGIKQKELAAGICSIPHLSKIENNSKEANPETITFLLKRLDVYCEEIAEKETLIQQNLTKLNEKMNYFLKDEANSAFKELEEMKEIIPFSSYLYTYELYKYRYLLFSGEMTEAGDQKTLLNKLKKNFSQHESYLFNYYNAVFWIMKRQYTRADQILDDLFADHANLLFPGEVLYHRALVKSALEESGHAIYFGKMALQSFMNQHNFHRILHTLMLLGINYTHSGIYEEALSSYIHLIRNAELLNEKTLLPQTYHNMGFLQKQMQNEKEALCYFQKSLAMQEKGTMHYIISLYSVGEVHFLMNNLYKAKISFEELARLAMQAESEKYEKLAHYFLLAIDSPEKAWPYLERSVIPCLEESREHKDDLIGFYKRLSQYHKSQGRYEQAVYYIEKIK